MKASLSNWTDFANAMGNARVNFGTHGTGLRILTGTVTSPTLGAQLKKLLAQFPEAEVAPVRALRRRLGSRRDAAGFWQAHEPCLSF